MNINPESTNPSDALVLHNALRVLRCIHTTSRVLTDSRTVGLQEEELRIPGVWLFVIGTMGYLPNMFLSKYL